MIDARISGFVDRLDLFAAQAPAAPGSLDLLSALRDIHEPAPPGVWPPAPGWWIVAGLVVVLLVTGLVWFRRRRARQRPIRIALAELERWHREAVAGAPPREATETLAALLRRAALVRYPRPRVAPLTGEAWLRFLDRTSGTHAFTGGTGALLGSARYAPDVQLDVAPLHAIAKRWLREHLDGPTVPVSDLPAAHGADGSETPSTADAGTPTAERAA